MCKVHVMSLVYIHTYIHTYIYIRIYTYLFIYLLRILYIKYTNLMSYILHKRH